jgi:hydrogenase maturation protease
MTRRRCLILACGNTLRSDDGVGPELAEWARERFRECREVQVIATQQWTPELSEEIRAADSVLFLDASISTAPGRVDLFAVAPELRDGGLATHHLSAAELLGLSASLYGAPPEISLQLSVGVASTELGERFSEPVSAALAKARDLLEKTILNFLAGRPAGEGHI